MFKTSLRFAIWIFAASSAYAIENSDADASKFLEEIVASDFAGDPSPRIGHVLLSRLSSTKQTTEAGPAFEWYVLDYDSLVVVVNWAFIGIERRAPSKVCGNFTFTAVAKTVGKGLASWMSKDARHIQALPKAETETVAYCAKFSSDSWKLINAPVPRVSKERMVVFMKERSARAAKIASEISNADPRAVTNAKRVSESLNEQLGVLLSL